jgi:hypothetical protein
MTENTDLSPESPMTAREFLRQEHLRPRSAMYRRFRQQVDESQFIDGLEHYPSVETAVRRLFDAAYELHGPYPSRPHAVLLERLEASKCELTDRLIDVRLCMSRVGAREIADELAGLAKQSALHPLPTERQLAYEQGRKKAPVARWSGKRMPRPKVPYQEIGASGVAHLDQIKANAHSAALIAQRCGPFWEAIEAYNYSQNLMHSLFKCCKYQDFNKDEAVAVAATILDAFIEDNRRLRRESDLASLRDAVITPAMSRESEQTINMIAYKLEADGSLSQALAVVLLAAQKHVAREAAIDMVRAIERREIDQPTVQGFVKVNELMHQHFLPLSEVIKDLDKQHMLAAPDLILLQRHQTNICASAYEFLKQQAGRGTER